MTGAFLLRRAGGLAARRAVRRASSRPNDPDFIPTHGKPYPMGRNMLTVGLIATFSVASYYWTLDRMKQGHEDMMHELDDADAGYSSVDKNVAAPPAEAEAAQAKE